MPGTNPPIPVPQTPKSTSQSEYTVLPAQESKAQLLPSPHTVVHQYRHMHQQAFTPILHQSPAGFPAPAMTGAQDSNIIQYLPRGTTGLPSFTPVTAFHRATQKSFKSKKRGRWGSLHVCIAWQIYYHEQLKKMQPKPNSLHRELTTRLPDSVQHKEPDQRSCLQPYLDSTCGQSAYGERRETGKTTENRNHFKKSYPSDLYTSSTASSRVHSTKLGQIQNLNWAEKMDEKEEHRHHQLDACLNVLPLKEKSWDHTVVTAEPDGRHDTVSHDRKRLLECGSFINVKRVKQEVVDDQFNPSILSTARTDPSSHTMSVQHINMSDTCAMYCNSSGCNVTRTPSEVVSYPGAEMYPYQTASWEKMWNEFRRMDHSLRQQLLGDYLLDSCKVIKMPDAAQKHKEVFPGLSAPHFHFPLVMRQQETAYLSRRKFMTSGNESHHLHHCRHHHRHSATSHLLHPGFLAASYTGC